MTDRERAREVRDIAAKAAPFIKQRLLDLADRDDDKRKTTITPLPSAPAAAQNPSGEHDSNSGWEISPCPVVKETGIATNGLSSLSATGTD